LKTERSTGVRIDVYSDVICPWCYVGKRRLERAVGQLGGTVTAQITWRPFQLNPGMPKKGMERVDYLKAKFGSLDAYKGMETHLLVAGETEQIPFAFGKIARTPNTFAAHRLIWYAGRHGCQDTLVESLFKGYFEEGADIGSIPALIRLAEGVGLSAEGFLFGEEGTAEVKADEASGHQLGIRSVPYFLLNQAYGISGAQPVDLFVSAIQKVQDHYVTANQSPTMR